MAELGLFVVLTILKYDNSQRPAQFINTANQVFGVREQLGG
jgi:hypothetical protein